MSARRFPGIIDSLASGFSLVVRRPYLIVVPVLLDILAWKGPGISAGPVIQRASSWFLATVAAGALSPDQLLEANAEISALADTLSRWNVLGVLGWQVPNFLGLGSVDTPAAYVSISSLGSLVPLLLALALGGTLLGCLFLGPLGRVVRGIALDLPTFVRHLPGLWARFTAYLGLLILLGVTLGIPALLLTGLAMAFSPAAVALVMLLAIGGAFLLAVYLFLGDEAVIVGGVGPVRAIRESLRIATRHFWSVVGLFLLVTLISQGLDIIWRRIAPTTIGMWSAIIGSAFISTGLAASVMVYYWGRRPSVSEVALPREHDPGRSTSAKDGR